MKSFKFYFFAIVFISFGLAFSSCSDDDDDFGITDENTAVYKGKTYTIYGGSQTYYDLDDDDNIDVYLYLNDDDDTDFIYLELGVPSGNKTLPSGDYSYHKWDVDEDEYIYKPFTFTSDSEIYISGFQDITGGKVKVKASGNTYEIQVDCSLKNGESIKAYYKGRLTSRD